MVKLPPITARPFPLVTLKYEGLLPQWPRVSTLGFDGVDPLYPRVNTVRFEGPDRLSLRVRTLTDSPPKCKWLPACTLIHL